MSDDYFEDFLAETEDAETGHNFEVMENLENQPENIHEDMTEKEAFDAYDLAFALGFGEEIGLEEAERFEAAKTEARSFPSKEPISIKEAKARGVNIEGRISTLTGKLKCPFEQWMKDVCAGRKTVSDPIGGENSYGKNYDLYAG